jgi:uncharacterized membrane protein
MQFLYSPLTWGFMLIGVPILVHLINLVRHRRQKWAAMEFLLESYRRNRRWVMLKQWLLLLARMLAMALLVMMLAKWVSNAQWLGWLGGRTTHHFILLDDSYSMSSRQPQNETAYDRALRALAGLTEEIASQPGDHQITLIRWSRAALAMRDASGDQPNSDQPNGDDSGKSVDETDSQKAASDMAAAAGRIDLAADLLAQTVSGDPLRLLERINSTAPTALQLTPETPLELIQPTLASQTGELPIVYMLTDLRRNQFAEAEALKAQLQQLSKMDVPIHLIDCSEGEGQNLSVVSLVPEQEVWAAGVPLLVRFAVRNPSNLSAKNIVAKVRVIVYADNEVTPTTEREYSGNVIELPPVVIEAIEPGQTVSRQVQVVFPAAGGHVVEVSIPDDVLAADNSRWCTIDIRQSQRILLVDGDVQQTNAFYFESVIQPGENLQTGMTVEKVDASYLRDVRAEELASFDVVALLDVPRMDTQAVDKLTEFAESGGGVLLVCGQNTNLAFANEQLYRNGNGLLPVELREINEPPEVLGSNEPQVVVSEHPIMAPLQKLSSSPFFALKIRKHILPSESSLGSPGLQVVATGPDKQPLLIDKAVGVGRTLTLLTGLSNDWSTWAQDPTFVVFALRSLGYLGSFRREATEAPAGSPLNMVVTNKSILPQGDVLMPTGSARRIRLQRQVDIAEGDTVARISLSSNLQAGNDRTIVDGLLRSGVFESWMTTSDGTLIVNNAAHNVAPEEGNLERISHQEIERQFPGVDLRIRNSSALASGLGARESSQSNLIMGLLVALLLGEQILAYSASYHAKSTARVHGVAQRDGGGR